MNTYAKPGEGGPAGKLDRPATPPKSFLRRYAGGLAVAARRVPFSGEMMNLHMGCGHLNDTDFLEAFEACTIPHGTFHHADHVRLAFLYVGKYGPGQAEQQLLAGIRRMAVCANAPAKFLYTTTVAWARLVAHARAQAPAAEPFSTWIGKFPTLLDRDLLAKYYSKDRLLSPESRSGWLEPDLAPLEIS